MVQTESTKVHVGRFISHALRSHCSMRRWQYWKDFSLRRSFGESRRLEEEVAETMETTDPSTSDRSSVRGKVILDRLQRDAYFYSNLRRI